VIDVLVPWADGSPHVQVLANLSAQGVTFKAVRMHTDQDYPHELAAWWADGRPFVVVEHDICPWPGAIDQLAECPQPWCALPYIEATRLAAFLGCTYFDPARLGPSVPLIEGDTWMTADTTLIRELHHRWGSGPHLHGPPVVHLNPTAIGGELDQPVQVIP
jgi:hypothetical protein